jgi:hypothetical protein
MDRSEPTQPKRKVGNLTWTGGRARILGRRLPLLDCHERLCSPGPSVYPCCGRHHVGDESVGARPAIQFTLSYAGCKRERGCGRCTA